MSERIVAEFFLQQTFHQSIHPRTLSRYSCCSYFINKRNRPMKTIAQFVEEGINNLADLQAALQTAMQLEFSTIPPYLCAQWSIETDPGGVGDTILEIAEQEMFHFALAGNMLTAVGGTPNIANAAFVPTFPTNELPGGISQMLAVDLQPLSHDQLKVFMQIEFPEFPPVARRPGPPPATIGAFYNTIADGFTAINPTIHSDAHFIEMRAAVRIESIADALAAIARIKGEGEGTPGSPDQPPASGIRFAHYYVFKEIFIGKALVQEGGGFSYTGPAIQFPTVFPFKQSSANPNPSLAFNQKMSQLLIDLEKCWTSGADINIAAMFDLQDLGQDLIRQGIRPEFKWAPPSNA